MKFKISISLILIFVIFLVSSFSCFAASNWSVFLDSIYVTGQQHIGTVIVNHQTRSSTECTRIVATQSGDLIFFYALPQLISGQSIILNFGVERYSGANARVSFYINNSDTGLSSDELPVMSFLLSDMGNPGVTTFTYKDFSFVYSGGTRLWILVQPTSLASATGDFTAWFTRFNFSVYNPNATLESQNNELIELNSEMQSIVDEHASIQESIMNEQNSIQDDIRSGLFDNGVSYTVTEPEFGSALTVINDGMQEFQRGAINSSAPKIQRGLLAFSALFTMVYDIFIENSSTSWIPACMWITAGLSVTALILGNLSQVAGGISLGSRSNRSSDFSRDYYYDDGKVKSFTRVTQKGNTRNVQRRYFNNKKR